MKINTKAGRAINTIKHGWALDPNDPTIARVFNTLAELVLLKTGGTVEEALDAISAKVLVESVDYNGATGDLTINFTDGTNSVINLPTDNFLSAASFDPATNILTLTLADNTTFDVPLVDLIKTYQPGAGLELIGNTFGVKDGGISEVMLDVPLTEMLYNKLNRDQDEVMLGTLRGLGYIKSGSDNNHVLLGDGSDKLISEIKTTINTNPIYISMNGIKSAGYSPEAAAADHIHPSDTSKFSVTGGALTGPITATAFMKTGMPSNQILMADGTTIVPARKYSFTPTIRGLTTDGTFSYDIQKGSYVIGTGGITIHVAVIIQGAFTTQPTGDIVISLPITITTDQMIGIITHNPSANLFYGWAISGNNYIKLIKHSVSGSIVQYMQGAEFGEYIAFSQTFII